MTSQYSKKYDDTEHFVTEHDEKWVENFAHSYTIPPNTQICCFSTGKTVFNNEDVLSYTGFAEKFQTKRFSFICIDAPFGGRTGRKHFARVDVCNMRPNIVTDSFVIMFDG